MSADSETAFQKHRVRMIGGAAFACLLLASCALFVPDIDDLRLVDVRSVEAGALDLHGGYSRDWWSRQPANYAVGKITVATKTDLHDFVWRHEFALWEELTICETGAHVVGEPFLYYEGVTVEYNQSDKEIERLYHARVAGHSRDEPYAYEIYFRPRANYKETKGPGVPWQYDPYDFIREPRDLCLRIAGGALLQGAFESNTVVIPSGDLKRAFEKVRD